MNIRQIKNIINRLKAILLLQTVFLLIGTMAYSQSPYDVVFVVTSNADAGVGTLRDALTNNPTTGNAIDQANSGLNVLIAFQVAFDATPGNALCQISTELPAIAITSGSITFDVFGNTDPLCSNGILDGSETSIDCDGTCLSCHCSNGSMDLDEDGVDCGGNDCAPCNPQGIEYASTAGNSAYLFGLLFISTSTSPIYIQNITFENFINHSDPAKIRSVIGISEATNVNINNCLFDENDYGITVNSGSNINILSNTFNHSTGGGGQVRIFTSSFGATTNVTVDGNSFSLNNPSGVGIVVSLEKVDNGQITVTNNTLNTGSLTIGSFRPVNSDPLTSVHVSNNNLSISSIGLQNPLLYWEIENNTMNNGGISILSFHPLPNILGIHFIESTNTLGYTPDNTGNTFTGTNTSFNINSGFFGNHIQLIGMDIQNVVIGSSGNSFNTEIRETKINSFGIDKPIRIFSAANGGITPPSIQKANLNSGDLIVRYTLPSGLNSINEEFVVDFYESNLDGDILDYLGTDVISTLTGLPYNHTIFGTSLTAADRIAATVTSIGGTGKTAIGTSEATYFFVTTCVCGNVFYDIECDGIMGSNPGMENWEIELYDDGGVVVATTTTDANGDYCFIDIVPGTYTIAEEHKSGWTMSFPWPVASAFYNVTIVGGENIQDLNFGNCFGCSECPTSFAPIPGDKYVLSAWVKEATPTVGTQYAGPVVLLDFFTASGITNMGPFTAKGNIIDGWQRIEEEFTVPLDAAAVHIILENAGSNDVFFDDIRIFPFNASMKSFVYDLETLRLMAVLDENNYATYYEYDEEGGLIRIKNETERGVVTIQESKNSSRKQP